MAWRRKATSDRAGPERVALLDGWSIEVPAGFARADEPDGAVVVWDDTRTVRAMTAATSGRADGSPLSADDMLGEARPTRERGERGVVLELAAERAEEIDGERVFTVSVRAVSENHLTIVYFHAREPGLEPWAHAAGRTLRR